MNKYLPLAGLVAVVGVIVVAIFVLSNSQRSSTSQVEESNTKIEAGQKAPNFTTNDFSGNKVTLSQFEGKPVFVDFWASWCPPCVGEIPEIEKIHKEFPDLVVIGVHRTDTEDREVGATFARKLGATYLLVEDTSGEIYKTLTRGDFRGMPFAVFIDKNGVIVNKKTGPKTAEEMREQVSKIIK